MSGISDDELGLLVWCALDYDRRLPGGGFVPHAVWEALSDEWKLKINRWKGASTDMLGAEIRPRGGEDL